MKLSNRTRFIIVLAMIPGLILASYWHIQRFRKSEIKLPEIEISTTEFEAIDWQDHLPWEKTEKKQEWISPGGSLKLKHPGSWVIMDQQVFGYAAEAGVMLTETEILLFAYRFKITEQVFAFLTVNQLSAEKTLEEIIAEIEENIKTEGAKAEMTISEIESGIAKLTMISKYPAQLNFYSEGKIIFGDKKTYIVSVTTPQHDWPRLKEEAKEILDSIELLK